MVRVPLLSDAVQLVRAQTEVLTALPATVLQLNRSARLLADALGQTAETVAAVQRLAIRMENVVTELEQPLLDLAPGITRLARALDHPVIEEIPESLAKLQADALPILRSMHETQVKVATIAASTERLVRMGDDLVTRIGHLPGAGLFGVAARRRPKPPVPAAAVTPASMPPEIDTPALFDTGSLEVVDAEIVED
ncbi:MAG: uncharacterized protein JWM48_149 [Mycobacterium sp.]|jgi:hypothetical protein|nr:uncharacterized protein [Mycobacterium sp.]